MNHKEINGCFRLLSILGGCSKFPLANGGFRCVASAVVQDRFPLTISKFNRLTFMEALKNLLGRKTQVLIGTPILGSTCFSLTQPSVVRPPFFQIGTWRRHVRFFECIRIISKKTGYKSTDSGFQKKVWFLQKSLYLSLYVLDSITIGLCFICSEEDIQCFTSCNNQLY